ncbi:MAG TPA: serine hydrolase [Puia sp.]|nr:serine hydrolase [Puia sp.]
MSMYSKIRTYLLFLLAACFIPSCLVWAKAGRDLSAAKGDSSLIVYPAPPGSPGNDDFTVKVRRPGQAWQDLYTYLVKVDQVIEARHTPQGSSMAYFDFSGTVNIAVTWNKGTIHTVRIRPLSYGIQPVINGNTIRFSLSEPRNLSIEVNGELFHNLHLFAGPVETCRPSPTDPHTIYYGPGIHQVGRVTVPGGTTVYIAGGALVEGQFLVSHVENVRILGRGILYQTKGRPVSTPAASSAAATTTTPAISAGKTGNKIRNDDILVEFSKNVEINGIIVLPVTYTVLMGNSEYVTIRNLKSFSAGGNNDGIDVFCSKDVLIDSVFMRNSDDNIAIYGHRWGYYGNTRNITVSNSVLWADVAHPILIGTHGDPPHPDTLEEMKFVNLDILDQAEAQIGYQGCMSINAGDANLVRDIRFENIRVEDIRQGQLVNLRVMYNRKYNTAPGGGIENVLFKNISYEGSHANLSVIAGYDSLRNIRNVTFEDLRINGKLIWDRMPGKPAWYLTGDFAHFFVGEHVEGLKFISSDAAKDAAQPAVGQTDDRRPGDLAGSGFAAGQGYSDEIYQYSVPVGGRTAYLWIPPACRQVRGVILAMENALELNWMNDPIIRKEAAADGLAMIWLSDGKPTDITWEMKPEAVQALDKLFYDLALESGYAEIGKAPIIVTGHSWNGRMAWTYPAARAERVIASIPIRTYPMPDSLLFSGIPLCYMVGQTTELPEFSDGSPGDRDFFWPVVRRTALALRSKNEDNLIGVVTYPGGCHMDWSDEQSRFLALFIHKACQYRLPKRGAAGNGETVLRKIVRSSGWLTDSGGMEADRFAPAPYKQYKGDPKSAYWFFDEEMARAAVAFNGDRKKRKLQMVSFVQKGVAPDGAVAAEDAVLPVAKNGYVKYKFSPEADGLTFKVGGGFLEKIPEGLIGAGNVLGHAGDGRSGGNPASFTFRVTMGPAIQVGPDEFRIQFSRQKPRNVMIMATQSGDAIYRRAPQPALVEILAKLTQGQEQSIDFPVIADQKVGLRAQGLNLRVLGLNARSGSGLPVRYYVLAGPARVEGDSLRITEIPVRSRYPVKVTVVAYQWGRVVAPLYQSAEPVKREFYINRDGMVSKAEPITKDGWIEKNGQGSYPFPAVTAKIGGWVDSGYYQGASLIVGRVAGSASGKVEVIYEKYFGKYTPGTVAYIASAGKWLAAATIAAVVDRGLLSWDDPVKKWLPAFTGLKGEATLRQLLSHTAGYPDYQPRGRHPDNYSSLQESVTHIVDLPADTVPGAVFHYGGLAMQVAGRMAELATGKDWESIFQEYIAGPLDMSATHYTPVDTTQGHNPMLGGGARTALHDYFHFLTMIVNDGSYEGKRILSVAAIHEMQADQVGSARLAPGGGGEYVARTRGRVGTDIYGLGEWREEVNAKGAAVLISSPSWAGAYPWIDKKNKIVGFFLARVNVERANAGHFSAFYSSPVLPTLVREEIKENKFYE